MVRNDKYCEACGSELTKTNWYIHETTPGGEVIDAVVGLEGEGPFPVCDQCWMEVSELISEKGKERAKDLWTPTPLSKQ